MVAGGRRYEVQAPLGKGGFGTIYKARFVGEGGFTKVVALKVLNPNMADMEDVVARLRDEAKVLGLLRHRAIVQADRLVKLRDRWAVVMEYVEGVDFKKVLGVGRVPVGSALEIIGEVAGALHAAYHTAGPSGAPLQLLHRDIKPSNLILTSYGEVKVLDFGIARAEFGGREAETQAFRMGSLPYMAPERLDFRDTAAADVYALGVVFFELVTGRAFGRASPVPERHDKRVQEALDHLCNEKEVDVSRDLLLFLGSLLAYEPDDRPTARDLERMCVNLRRRLSDEPLRYWAEKVVPPLLAKYHADSSAELSGYSLVEQTEGSFGSSLDAALHPPVEERSASPGSSGTITGSQVSETSSVSASVVPPEETSSSFSPPTDAPPDEIREERTDLPPPPTLPAADGKAEPAPRPVARRSPLRLLGLLFALCCILVLLVFFGGMALFAGWKVSGDAPPPEPLVADAAPPDLADEPLPAEGSPEQELADEDLQPAEGLPAQDERSEAQATEPQLAPAEQQPAEEAPSEEEEAAEALATEAPVQQTPVQAEAQADASVQVEVTGDAVKVRLYAKQGRHEVPGRVPEGTYSIRADFGSGEAMGAGHVALQAGSSVTIHCNAMFTRCKVQ